MSRKRNTDHDSAIEAAEKLFWSHGYHRASTREIEAKTGLTRFTLQTTYEGKEGFFLNTLDSYLDKAESEGFPNSDTYDLEDLAVWFEQLVAKGRMPNIEDNGCLAFNSIHEFGRENPSVNARIERYLKNFESCILRITKRAVTNEKVNSSLSAQDMTRLLMDLFFGLQVIIKARNNDSLPRLHAKSISTLIRSWKK